MRPANMQPSAMLSLILTLSLTLSLTASEAATGFQPLRYIGYWHDGSGVFRNCNLVDTWNEWDFKKVVAGKDSKGRDATIEVPDKERRVNIVWKVPHYNWCNGGLIVAGGKVFGLSDRSGFGFHVDQPADFTGAWLYCIDPATGKELWKVDVHPWDLVPDGAALQKDILVYNRRECELSGAWMPLGTALRERHSGRAVSEGLYKELSAIARPFFPDLAPDLASLKGTIYDNTGYPQGHFRKLLEKSYPDVIALKKRIQAAGYLLDPWANCGAPLGLNMQTPVSDGKHLYIVTAFGLVACLDLDGKYRWKRHLGTGWERGGAIPSPVLSGDRLHIVAPEEPVGRGKPKLVRTALNTKDGSVVWTAPYGGSYQTGPVVLDLPIGGDANTPLRVLYFSGSGVVLRESDGKQLLEGLPAAWNGRPTPVSGDVLIMNNKSADGGGGGNIKNDYEEGWSAIRLKAESNDKVVPETLWAGKPWGWGNVIARDGVVFAMGGKDPGGIESFDLKTGASLGKAGGKVARPFHYPILAGDLLLGLDVDGHIGVSRVSADGRSISFVGNNQLGDRRYGDKDRAPGEAFDARNFKFSYGCQIFASGNRLFVRSMTELYCIGDPTAPMQLSPEHR